MSFCCLQNKVQTPNLGNPGLPQTFQSCPKSVHTANPSRRGSFLLLLPCAVGYPNTLILLLLSFLCLLNSASQNMFYPSFKAQPEYQFFGESTFCFPAQKSSLPFLNFPSTHLCLFYTNSCFLPSMTVKFIL